MPDRSKSAKSGRRSLLRVIFSRTAFITLLLLLNFYYLFSVLFGLFKFVPVLFGSVVVLTAVMELVILNSGTELTQQNIGLTKESVMYVEIQSFFVKMTNLKQ